MNWLAGHNLGHGRTIQSSEEAVVSEPAMSEREPRHAQENEEAELVDGERSSDTPIDTISQNPITPIIDLANTSSVGASTHPVVAPQDSPTEAVSYLPASVETPVSQASRP